MNLCWKEDRCNDWPTFILISWTSFVLYSDLINTIFFVILKGLILPLNVTLGNWVFYQLCHLSLAIPALSLAIPALSLSIPALSLSIPALSLDVPGVLAVPGLSLALSQLDKRILLPPPAVLVWPWLRQEINFIYQWWSEDYCWITWMQWLYKCDFCLQRCQDQITIGNPFHHQHEN